MPIISYHSTTIDNIAAHPGAVDTTSSQILLSRAIADHSLTSRPPVVKKVYTPIAVTSVYESPTRHIMTVGDAASTSKDVGLDGEQRGEDAG